MRLYLAWLGGFTTALGVTLFNDGPFHGHPDLLWQAIGLGAFMWGIFVLLQLRRSET